VAGIASLHGVCDGCYGWTRTKYSSPPAWLICIIGALAHAPKHSTSIRWNMPSAVSPTFAHSPRADQVLVERRSAEASQRRDYTPAGLKQWAGRAIRRTPNRAIQSGLDRIENVVRPQNHARGGRAHLNVVLPDLFATNVHNARSLLTTAPGPPVGTTDRYVRADARADRTRSSASDGGVPYRLNIV
jgi:hypothetical protein